MNENVLIAEASPAAIAAAAGWLAGRAQALLANDWWKRWVVYQVTSAREIRFDHLAYLEGDIGRECKRANVRGPKLEDFFAGRTSLPQLAKQEGRP